MRDMQQQEEEDKPARETRESQPERQRQSSVGTGHRRVDGWEKAGREAWSVLVVLAKWLRRATSEANWMPGQSRVTFCYRGTTETVISEPKGRVD